MNNILFYVHYNKNSDLHAHVAYHFEKLRPLFKRVVLVSNSPLSSKHTSRLSTFVDDIFERENIGFDFYAWKEALDREGHARLADYDSVTLMNDTWFGPLFDMGEAYDRMLADACNFWGMINHRRKEEMIPELGTNIPEHIQSFFLVFKREVVNSPSWRAFWGRVECETNVFRVIAKYEVQLTQILCEAGFKYKVLLDTLQLDLAPEELSYVPADYCINNRLPTLKIKALLQHKDPRHIIGEIRRSTSYPVALIEDYITKDFQPDRSVLYCDKVLNVCTPVSSPTWPTAAIHVHVFYIDVWERYLQYLQVLNFPYALYVTTDSEEKAAEIETLLEQFPTAKREKFEITTLPNKGRDVVPWLRLAEKLGQYDRVLHAHTKRSPTAVGWVGASWQQDIFDAMLEQAPRIAQAFTENPNLGIAIPDVPRFWRYIAPVRREGEAQFIGLMDELWREMGCDKKVDFGSAPAFVMPYGTMFWYRPAALQKMTSLALGPQRVPDEPLPDRTVLHALERLMVYVAWDAGFDYRIVPPKEVASGFVDGIVRNQHSPRPPAIENVVQQPPPTFSGGISEGHKVTQFRRGIAILKALARPRRLVKMITPYGVVRLLQKYAEHRRPHIQRIGETPVPKRGRYQKSREYWLRSHPHLQPMNIVRDGHAAKRLNLVISSLGRAQLFGGIATCTGIATVVAKELGLPLRIITRDGHATLEQYWAISAALGIEPCADVSFYSDSFRDEVGRGCPPVYCSDLDIFLASSWWTATVLRQSVENKNVYHIIQEDELMFYQRGDDYLDCWNALNAPDSKYIVNSSYLHAWFKQAYPQIYGNSVVFEPVFRKDVSRDFPAKETYNLFFYARMTNPRNLFWFGMQIIDDCFKKGILDPREWNIYFAGDDTIPLVEFFGGKPVINLGILSWQEYHDFLKDVDLGVCLIHTPHPGYPVYDVASAGGIAVTNTLYTKASFPCSENIIACDLSVNAFMDGMQKAVVLAKDGVTRRKNYLNQDIPCSWNHSLVDVVAFFKEEAAKGGATMA